ncbi:MAG: 50S ribosomal protein L9 [Patescibacteria group bacterium]
MKVILLQDIAKLGKKFEVVNVSDGYATNYLLPRKMAEQATPSKEKELEKQKTEREAERETYIEKLYEDLSKIKDRPVKIEAKTNEKGRLFAGLEKSDLLSALKEQEQIDIDEDLMILESPIKDTGEYVIAFKIGNRDTELTFSVESPE